MKNVLIPTTLNSDTLKAVKAITANMHNGNTKIVLLLLSECLMVSQIYSSLPVQQVKFHSISGRYWMNAASTPKPLRMFPSMYTINMVCQAHCCETL